MAIRPVPADRDEWLKLREPYLGASECCALMGVQADFHHSPYTLWAVKSGKISRPEIDIDNDRMLSGRCYEPGVVEFCATKRGWTIQPGVFAIDDVAERFAATLDRVIAPSEELAEQGLVGPGALEAKFIEFDQSEKWEGEEPPPYYLIQHQAQMACTGWQWGAVVAKVGSRHVIRIYPRHEGIIAEIRQAVDAFWAAVAFGVEPTVDHYESTARTLKALYPRQTPNTVLDLRGDNALPDLCIRKKKLACLRIQTEKDEDKIENLIRAKIGANETALVAGGISVKRSVGKDTLPRPAEPGELIGGRRGQDKLTINVPKEMLA